MPPDLHLLRPLWLLALIPLGLLLWRLARRGEAGDAWRGVVDAHLLSHLLDDDRRRVRRLPLVLLSFGWLLAVLALAGPVWERLPQPVYQTQSWRVIVLDISPSMNATDLPPSRLARARFEVLDLLKRSEEGQTALLAYGAEPFVVSPLTTDAETIAAQVPSLDTALLPVEGDRRADLALEQAGELLQRAGAPDGEIVLVTDGLDHPVAAQEAAGRLRDAGYRLSVMGVGTEQGAPVPLEAGGFHKDEQGAILLPKLKTGELEALAGAGGGRYVTAGNGDADTAALIPDPGGRRAETTSEQNVTADQWREEGPWLLLLLIPLAALAFRRGWLSPLAILLLVLPHPPAQAIGWDDLWFRPDQQAAGSFAAGEHARAAERFQRPDWRAAAQYEAGDYASALESLADLQDTEAGYNRGNALARLDKLEEAVAEYEKVLKADPGHEDARHNLDLLRKLLEQRQEKQEKQEQQQADNQNPQQSQGDSGSEQSQQGQQNQETEEQGAAQGETQDAAGSRQGEGQQQAQQAGQDGVEQQPQSGSEQQPEQAEQGSGEEQKGHGSAAESGEKGREQAQAKPELATQEKSGGQEPQGTASSAGQQEQGVEPSEASSASEQGTQDGGTTPDSEPDRAAAPGVEDLLGGPHQGRPQAAVPAQRDLEGGEERQAMEHMLRRVPDDPGGLLRQRFLLQHLRRSGRLP
jgi:Ca-activated chloride channel family protein